MGLKCRISYSASGQAMVTDANGNASKLFADALAVTQDQNAALNIWASAYTPEFQETFGTASQTEEPPVLQVVKYYQSLKQLDGRLEPKELFEVRQMMRTSGIRNLSDFSATLKSIFLQGDVPGIDENLAIESGLFLPEDLNSIDLPKVVDLIARMEGETLSNDFEVEPQDSEILYRDTAHKNIFGASETVTIEQIDSEVIDLIDNFQSEEEFYDKLQELPYSDFTARFYEDETFANEYMAKFQGLVKVPVIEERAGELVSDVTPTFSTVKNTILDGLDSITIDADISFINSIADNIWEVNAEKVSSVVQEIEAELATKNIDIIGLHNITTDKATLLEMLNAASVMVENPTDANILAFSQVYDKIFLRQPAKKVVKVPGNLQGLTLVSMYSAKTDQQLFDQHGLIKVGDNLYHKVDLTADISEAYEYLYQQMRERAFQIPYQYRTETNMDNKPAVLQDIAEFVNARETGLGFYNEKASLYQVVFGHPAINLVKESDMATSALNTLTTNEVYLKTDFVSDFYSMILQEKLADSPVYRNTLSKFSVTDNDITLTSDLVSDLTDIPMYQELMDYIKLRKNSSMKKFLPTGMMGDTNAAFSAYNFPTTIAQYTGTKAETQNLVVTPPILDDFIRIEDTVYQKVKVSETANVFLRLKPNNNSAYYTTTPPFANFTQEQIDRAAQTDMVTNTKLTGKDITARKEKSGVLSRLVNSIKTRSASLVSQAQQQATKAFETNLVEFLRQKGLPVVTDLAEMKAALAELGIDSVNQMFRFEDMGVKPTVSIDLNGNKLTVTPSSSSKIKTPQQAYGVANSIFQKVRKYVQDTTGPLFRENMVVREGTTVTLNIPADMQERVEQMRAVEEEIARIIDEQKQENSLEDYNPAQAELDRGVSPDVLKDLGYNMLQTPAGSILGFEYKGTIYLDPALLNNVTTLHELTHVFQILVKARANAGDTQAQKILQKREEVFGAMAREWEVFHKMTSDPSATGLTPLQPGEVAPQFQFIGEGNRLTNNDKAALTLAKQLEADNKTPEEIYQKTNWLKTNQGIWIREIGDLKVIPPTEKELNTEVKNILKNKEVVYDVEDLFDISEIGNRYNFDNLKIKVTYERNEKNQTISFASINSQGERSITTLIKGSEDYLRRYLGGENIGEIVISRRGPRGTARITAVQSFQSIINHEFQHILQAQDSTRKIGNSFNEIVKFFIRKNISAFPDIESISRDEIFNRLERIYQKEDFTKYAETLYRNSIGERQATEVELRMFDKSTLPENFEGAFNVDIQDVQTGTASFQIDEELRDTLGLDLSAPVYAQRQGESDTDYHNRLVNEVEAYVAAPEIAQKLEELRQTNPSLWSRITDFLKNLTTWLKTQIGLSDYDGDIMNMTKEEYTSALGVSILKEEYDDLFVPNNSNKIANEVINATVVLDSQVEMISLQTEEAQDALYNKIDNCG